MIVINREKAEEIVRDRLRGERAQVFPQLDLEFMRAIESGENTSVITEKKAALRAVTEKDFSNLHIQELAVLDLESALNLP